MRVLAAISTTCFRERKTWQRIFVLLKDGCLFLYSAPGDLQPLQQYPLYASACVFPQYPKVTRSNCLEVETPSHSLFLCADSPSDMKAWAVSIQKAAIVASGGTLGRVNAAATAAAAAAAASPMPRGSVASNGLLHSAKDGRSMVASAGTLTLHLPFPGGLPGGPGSLDASAYAAASHSLAASSLVAEASEAARYEGVLHRFRSGCTVTAFTSNALASLAPAYVLYRSKGKRRIAEGWQREKWRHAERNRMRAAPPAARHAGLPASSPAPGSSSTSSSSTTAAASSSASASSGASSAPSSSSSASSSSSSSSTALAAATASAPAWSDIDVPSLGTLRLSSLTVILGDITAAPASAAAVATPASSPGSGTGHANAKGTPTTAAAASSASASTTKVEAAVTAVDAGEPQPEAELSVTNTADYPVVFRVGDSSSAKWMRTNTPRFLAPGAACIVTFARLPLPAPTTLLPASAAASTPSSSSSSSAASSLPPHPQPQSQSPMQHAPSLPTILALTLRPCDRAELEGGRPLALFENEDGSLVHRVGERIDLLIKLKDKDKDKEPTEAHRKPSNNNNGNWKAS